MNAVRLFSLALLCAALAPEGLSRHGALAQTITGTPEETFITGTPREGSNRGTPEHALSPVPPLPREPQERTQALRLTTARFRGSSAKSGVRTEISPPPSRSAQAQLRRPAPRGPFTSGAVFHD